MENNEILLDFNEYYPFERYIFDEPKSIDNLFDDARLTEIFIPSSEPEKGTRGFYLNKDELYVKLLCKGVELRLGLFDFSDSMIETMIELLLEDFGDYEWQSLYIEYDDEDDYTELKDVLEKQKKLITEKYGKCEVKKNFKDETTMKLLKSL